MMHTPAILTAGCLEQAMTEIQHPTMRVELLEALRTLSDPDCQQRARCTTGAKSLACTDEPLEA
jgi:hypothetical protein